LRKELLHEPDALYTVTVVLGVVEATHDRETLDCPSAVPAMSSRERR
jgi:hypothetical protein